jgi:phage shock protein C
MAKKIALSSNKKIAGVCGGVAEYLGIDATIVRIIWLVLVLFYGVGLLAYIICWILFPKA